MDFRGLRLAAGLVLCLISGSAAAQEVADLWAGYKPTTDITMPFAEVAEVATVRIESAYIAVDETSLKAMTTVLTGEQPVVTDPKLLDLNSRLMQIETCRRQGLEICPILRIGGSGTGFIDNGRELFTCRHVVGDWPLVASLLNGVPVRSILPPMILRDRDGNLLYNSAYSSNALRFEALNEDPRLQMEAILKYRARASGPLPDRGVGYAQTLQYLIKASDFVAMAADADIIAPVPLTRGTGLAAGDRLYLSGFPVKTDLLPRNWDGSPDKLLVTSVLVARLLTPLLPMLMAEGLQTRGGSGGIVTDASGAVIGMSCFADTGKAFAFSFDKDAQAKFWDELRNADFTDVLADLPVESAARD
jgi:hypothetical protein